MRYLASEHPIILGKFETGATVTISLYDLSDSSSVTLTSNSCSEITTTGVYKWCTSEITTQPTVKVEYLWIMDDGNGAKQYGKIVLGGYMADILADTSELQNNQVNWLTATGFATKNPPSQNLNDYKADVSALALEANIEAHVTNSLNSYDPPTRAEATSDKNEILTEIGLIDTSFLIKIVKNRRILTKSGSTWKLIVYDDDTTPILDKVLHDKDGNDITDLDAGVLAQELGTTV